MRPDAAGAKRGTLPRRDGALLLAARHWDPFSVLGPHEASRDGERGTAVRAILPRAAEAFVVTSPGTPGERRHPMVRLFPEGIFECFLPASEPCRPYLLEAREGGTTRAFPDPYAFGTVLTEYDLHLAAEGTHLAQQEFLGSHLAEREGVRGVSFAVWAPNAERVSVVGDFNHWDGRCHPMRSRGGSGIWEIFVPLLAEGEVYKYEIRARGTGEVLLKTDPYGFRFEHPPRTGTVVCDLSGYAWGDGAWMEARRRSDRLSSPMSVYEVHVGSWRRKEGNRYLTWEELAEELVPYVAETGYTHVELLPVTEHPFDGSWGYQATGYFAPTARHGHPKGFMAFVDRCHRAGIGVILDWVPAHFPRDGHSLARFDGTCLYEHEDPRKGEHRDWGTLIYNYDRREVSAFLLSSALFWLETYHLDGLRVDAVASMLYLDYSREAGDWVPNEFGGRENLGAISFLRRMNEQVHGRCPGAVTVAEESTAWPMVSRPVYAGGLGFTLKWNMGWMHDMLGFMKQDPVHRKYHFGTLTFSLLYAFHENFVLPFSHDEVVHLKRSMVGKMPGDDWQKFANLRLLYAYMHAHPGKKLLFMGSDFGAWGEWDHDRSLPWDALSHPNHGGLHRLVRDLNRLHRELPPLHEDDASPGGFSWIDFHDAGQSVISFLRRGRGGGDVVACVFNFTPVPRPGYRVGLPREGPWREILNTDSEGYWGSGVGNLGSVEASATPWNGLPFSAVLTLPPLGALYLRPGP